MKKKESSNFSGITVCDSITMSVKKKRPDLRNIEAVVIAVVGFASVILSFLKMFHLNYSHSAAIKAALLFSVVYIIFSLADRFTLWLTGGSIIVFGAALYKNIANIVKGYKFVYNVIYNAANQNQIKYFKFLDPDDEKYCVTLFLVFCIWLLAIVIYTFTIKRPNPIPVIIVSFPIIEIGLYNGIHIPIFWGILTVAYWLSLLAMCSIDIGEYSGGNGGFVRKDNLFFPKRQMRLKVTEKCGLLIISSILLITGGTLAYMKLSGYERSKELNQKRSDIKYAINSFTFDDLASSVSALTESFGLTFNYESHKLGDVDGVRYKEVTDIVATFEKKCDNAVYLKGYSGAVYEDNEWFDLDSDAYKDANGLFGYFSENGLYPQDFPNILYDEADPDNCLNTVWLNAKRKKNKSYAPYGTVNYGGLKYDRDCTVSSKSNSADSYSYKFSNVNIDNVCFILGENSPKYLSVNRVGDSDIRSRIDEFCDENGLYISDSLFTVNSGLLVDYDNLNKNGEAVLAMLLENQYRDFVYDNYLQIPDTKEIDEVKAAYFDIVENGKNAVTAEEKLELLNQLRERISQSAEYSLRPGKTPSNRDFVNYFLLENHKGYCTHYASAGVLLARMAGIPARYATGYIVVSDDFNDSTHNADGTYTVTLKDNRSHAWTEVYIDGFGWMPFEFTAGYSNSTINTEPAATTSSEASATSTTTVTANGTTTSHTRNKQKTLASSTSTAQTSTETISSSTNKSSGGVTHAKASFMDKPAVRRTVCAVLIAAIAAAVIWLRRILILKKRRKRFAYGKNSDRVIAVYGYTESLLNIMKLKKSGMNYNEFAELAESRLSPQYFGEGEFMYFMQIALSSSFSDEQPSEADVKFAEEFSAKLAANIYQGLGFFRRLKMKLITVLI